MPELRFQVQSVAAAGDSFEPELVFALRIENAAAGESIESISLNTQIHIDPARRSYTADEQRELQELFGERERWASTMRPFFWSNALFTVSAFKGSTVTDLLVRCSRYPDDAAAKYFHALCEGEAPLELLFSGTVFYCSGGPVQVAFIPWSARAACRVPVQLLQQAAGALKANSIHSIDSRLDGHANPQMPMTVPTWHQILEQAISASGRRKA
ncbi:MAG TPA: DUF6084 family protein [Verrucomicrobiae bacterium]|nr:DUF6084 family protein [Verrucomicrobiae bacterium]